jgi:hypothetical protein
LHGVIYQETRISFGFKHSVTRQLLVYADDVNISGASIHTKNENTEAIVAASKAIVLEVNAEETKYVVFIETGMQDKITT